METEHRQEPKELKFVTIGGLRVYSPAMSDNRPAQKHACPDCHFCQFCSDVRCHNCRGAGKSAVCPSADRSNLAD